MRELKVFVMRLLLAAFLVAFCLTVSHAQDSGANSDLTKRFDQSAKVLDEIMSTPGKAIPNGVISRAKCVAVFPATVQVAILVGGKHGKGFATCRTAQGWSAPAPLDISGGSWGAQLGGQEVDLVLVVTDDKGVQQLESGKFNLGTETSVTGGPVGKEDMKMNADVVSYSRARGVFAGMNMNGSSITEDHSETRSIYGSDQSLADIFGGKVKAPGTSDSFLKTVEKYVGGTRNASR